VVKNLTDDGRMPEGFTESRATVLVVEDSYLAIAPTLELLKELGFGVAYCTNGPDALQMLEEDARIDVVAVDIGLPVMNGNELILRAREQRPGLKALVVTGYDPDVITVAEDDQTIYLTKPYMPHEFVERIRFLLSAGG
jgi:CheY-like chemotaxis protein